MSYFSKLFQTGAIRKTPSAVIRAILHEVPAGTPVRVVELGAGQGEITYPLAQKTKGFSLGFDAFEFDEELGAALQRNTEGIRVHFADAFRFPDFLPDKAPVDRFICALPLSFHPHPRIAGLLKDMRERLAPGGKVVIIFNAVWLLPLFRKELKGGTLRVFPTFPVYCMYVYRKS